MPGILAITTHCIAALLLLAILRKILVSEHLALVLALIFAIFPWSETALLWACIYTYLLATTLFLAVLCLLLRVFPLKDSIAVPLCVLLAALSLFSNEALFFALLVSGALVFVIENATSAQRPLLRTLPLAAAPGAGCLIWWILYKIFPGRSLPEHIRLNPRTLLSGVYYQYTNLWVFEPWKSRGTRDLLFFDWSFWQFATGIVLVVALALCVRQAFAPLSAGTRQRISSNRLLVFLMVLLVATVAIYAIGGGFSLDSRKKYPIIPVLLMALGYACERFVPRRLSRPGVRYATFAAVLMCGIATTWLQIGLWRYEVKRLDLLVDFLRTQRDPSNVRIDWDSRVQAGWAHANQHWGAGVEPWVISDALRLKADLSPPVPYGRPVAAVKFDPVDFAWQPAL